MNGRVYDYNMGRFMSVDPFIQSPTSTQSVNPYSYIMNNPLAGTDPTGYVSEPLEIVMCPPRPTCDAPESSQDRAGDKSKQTKKSNNGSRAPSLPSNAHIPMSSGNVQNIGSLQTINQTNNKDSKRVVSQLAYYGDLSKPYQLPNEVKDMARFCDGYPCGGSGEIESSLFFDDLLGLGLKSMIFLPMRAVGTHADDFCMFRSNPITYSGINRSSVSV